MKNWKTTLAGIASIITGISLIINGQLTEGVSAIVAGIGLIFATDVKSESTNNEGN